MGMFDYIEFEEGIELPEFEEDEPNLGWQTKEFQSLMRTYRVTEDGKMLEEEFETHYVPEEERPRYNEEIEGFENELEKLFGSMRRETTGWTEKNYHGRMRVVGHTDDYWYQYFLKFTDGRLEGIELSEKRERDNHDNSNTGN